MIGSSTSLLIPLSEPASAGDSSPQTRYDNARPPVEPFAKALRSAQDARSAGAKAKTDKLPAPTEKKAAEETVAASDETLSEDTDVQATQDKSESADEDTDSNKPDPQAAPPTLVTNLLPVPLVTVPVAVPSAPEAFIAAAQVAEKPTLSLTDTSQLAARTAEAVATPLNTTPNTAIVAPAVPTAAGTIVNQPNSVPSTQAPTGANRVTPVTALTPNGVNGNANLAVNTPPTQQSTTTIGDSMDSNAGTNVPTSGVELASLLQATPAAPTNPVLAQTAFKTLTNVSAESYAVTQQTVAGATTPPVEQNQPTVQQTNSSTATPIPAVATSQVQTAPNSTEPGQTVAIQSTAAVADEGAQTVSQKASAATETVPQTKADDTNTHGAEKTEAHSADIKTSPAASSGKTESTSNAAKLGGIERLLTLDVHVNRTPATAILRPVVHTSGNAPGIAPALPRLAGANSAVTQIGGGLGPYAFASPLDPTVNTAGSESIIPLVLPAASNAATTPKTETASGEKGSLEVGSGETLAAVSSLVPSRESQSQTGDDTNRETGSEKNAQTGTERTANSSAASGSTFAVATSTRAESQVGGIGTKNASATEPSHNAQIDRVRLVEQVSRHIETSRLTASNTELSLRLRPDHLGSLRITVTTHADGISARIVAEHAGVQSALDSSKEALRTALEAKGLRLNGLEVSVGQGNVSDGQTAFAGTGDNGADRNTRSYLRNLPRSTSNSGLPDTAALAAALPRRPTDASALLDRCA